MLTYPFMFSKEVINTLYKHCQIIILSSREDKYWNNKTYIFAKKWLKKYKFKFDMIKVNCIDKAGFCKNNNIDIMIEDNLEYVKRINDVGIKTILIKKSYNKNYQNKLNDYAINWIHVFEIINSKYFSNSLKLKLKRSVI